MLVFFVVSTVDSYLYLFTVNTTLVLFRPPVYLTQDSDTRATESCPLRQGPRLVSSPSVSRQICDANHLFPTLPSFRPNPVMTGC